MDKSDFYDIRRIFQSVKFRHLKTGFISTACLQNIVTNSQVEGWNYWLAIVEDHPFIRAGEEVTYSHLNFEIIS